MLNVLHKEYSLDVLDFEKQKAVIEFRRSNFGKASYWLGKVIALYYIIRVALSMK